MLSLRTVNRFVQTVFLDQPFNRGQIGSHLRILIIGKIVSKFKQALIQTQKEMREVTKLSDATTDGIRSTSFATCGVTCSTQINLETEGDIIKRVEIVKGCEGNTKGLARLCEGRRIQDVIGLLEGIDCKGRGTSCPDQLARALKQL